MTQAVNTIMLDALRDAKTVALYRDQYRNARPNERAAVLESATHDGWLRAYQVPLLGEGLEK